MDLQRLSKTLAHMLRHAPDQYGVVLDPEGFAPLEEVLAALKRQFPAVETAHLLHLAEPSDKQRFEVAGDFIRATYGHSVALSFTYPEAEPPQHLYHGTARRFLTSILAEGLQPRSRQYVHMAETLERARMVGRRRDDAPVILRVDALAAHRDGLIFYRAADQTWLARAMPPRYLQVLEE